MSRIRTVKPGFWADEDLSKLPEFTHMLACSLLNYADDEGYFNANIGLIKAACFPLRETSVSIHGVLSDLSVIGYIQLFDGSDNKQYGKVTNFLEHQRVNRPRPSRIKLLVEFTESSVINHGGLSEGSLHEGNGMEWNGKKTQPVENPPAPENLDFENQGGLFASELDEKEVNPTEVDFLEESDGEVAGTHEKTDDKALNPKQADLIKTIFEFWRTELNHPKSKFGDDRKSQIKEALKTYSFEECISAIRGIKNSPHHMGDNDRNTAYDSIELIFRNSTLTDKFISFDIDPPEPPNSPTNSPTQASDEDIFGGAI